MKSRNKARRVISLLLSLLLTMLLTVMMVAVGLMVGLCRKDVFLKHVSNSDYYRTLYEQLQQEFDTLLEGASLPLSVGEDVLQASQVYIDGRVYITSVLEGKQAEIDTSIIEKKLKSKIENYLIEQKMDAEAADLAVQQIVEEAAELYRTVIPFHYADYFYQYRQSCLSVMYVLLPICAIAAGIIVYLLLRMYRRKHRALRYMVYALTAATVANLLYTVHLQRILRVETTSLSDSAYAQMAQGYLQESAGQGYYVSLLGAVLTAGLLVLIHTRKKNSRRGIS